VTDATSTVPTVEARMQAMSVRKHQLLRPSSGSATAAAAVSCSAFTFRNHRASVTARDGSWTGTTGVGEVGRYGGIYARH